MLKLLSKGIALLFISLACVQAEAKDLILDESELLWIDGDVNSQMVVGSKRAVEYLRSLDPDKHLVLLINSPGGYIDYVAPVIEVMNSLKNVEMVCVTCSSGAAAIFTQFSGPRHFLNKSHMLIHEMQVCGPISAITDEALKAGREDNKIFAKYFWSKMKWSEEKYTKWISGKDQLVTPKFVIDNNLADDIVKIKCNDKTKKKFKDGCNELENL